VTGQTSAEQAAERIRAHIAWADSVMPAGSRSAVDDLRALLAERDELRQQLADAGAKRLSQTIPRPA
jgi:hypothetical protein